MGLTTDQIRNHIDFWTEQLKQPTRYDYRSKWPRYLFRHEPLENAVRIIQSGQLLSREDAQNVEHLDIAAPSVINARNEAHRFARLYFRPLNPTQYHVEGIRKQDEFYQDNDQTNAPILVMFLFSAESVLAMPDTFYSNGNMQGGQVVFSDSEDFFKSINFEHVYHEGPFNPVNQPEIKKARCAEVLTGSPLILERHLMGIRCRSEAERATLLYRCGDFSAGIRTKIRTYTEVGLFQNRFAFLKSVDLSSEGVKL